MIFNNSVVPEMLPFECVQTHGHIEPLIASPLLAYRAAFSRFG